MSRFVTFASRKLKRKEKKNCGLDALKQDFQSEWNGADVRHEQKELIPNRPDDPDEFVTRLTLGCDSQRAGCEPYGSVLAERELVDDAI